MLTIIIIIIITSTIVRCFVSRNTELLVRTFNTHVLEYTSPMFCLLTLPKTNFN